MNEHWYLILNLMCIWVDYEWRFSLVFVVFDVFQYFTYCCALSMTVAFGFYHVHFLLKLSIYLGTFTAYAFVISPLLPEICKVHFHPIRSLLWLFFLLELGPFWPSKTISVTYFTWWTNILTNVALKNQSYDQFWS